MPGPVEDCDFELWKKIQATNLDSTFLGCQQGLKAIKASGGGSIVNFASSLADSPMSIQVPYGASKSGVINITRTVALHCAEQGYDIRVNAVAPGAIDTPMYQAYLAMSEDPEEAAASFAAAHPMGRVGKPEEVARATLFLASDLSSFTTGSVLNVDGGIAAT